MHGRRPGQPHVVLLALGQLVGANHPDLMQKYVPIQETLPQLAPEEKTLWVCGSFAPPLIVLLSIVLTLDGFTSGDKYAIVIILLGVVPLACAWFIARAQPYWMPSAMDFLRLNLTFTLLGSL